MTEIQTRSRIQELASLPERPEVLPGDLIDIYSKRHAFMADAEAWFAKQVAGVTDPEAYFEKVATIYRAAEKRADITEKDRDALVWVLSTYFWVRRGASLAGAIGVNRSGLQKVRDRLKKNPPVEDAERMLALGDPVQVFKRAAKAALVAQCRERVALAARDAAAHVVTQEHGWSNARVARVIGRHASRVSRIKRKEVAA